MPIYDYVCGACGTTTEVVHGIHDEGPRFCPACGAKGRMKKAFAPPTIVFKGSGWAKKDRSSTATGAGSGRTSGASKPDAKEPESASDAATSGGPGSKASPAATDSADR
jgi:putative FmdB family regulatory protein